MEFFKTSEGRLHGTRIADASYTIGLIRHLAPLPGSTGYDAS
jgi:hypothetical protein